MRLVRVAAIVALGFLGLSAVAGGVPMILDPQGNMMRLPLSLLRTSPFHSYLIPGIILLGANGLLALWVLWLVILRKPGYGLWTAFQGCVLLGWLVVECWMLRLVIWPHYLYGAVALVLVATGFWLRRDRGPAVRAQG